MNTTEENLVAITLREKINYIYLVNEVFFFVLSSRAILFANLLWVCALFINTVGNDSSHMSDCDCRRAR